MVHRWRCRRCDFTVWSASQTSTVDTVESHTLGHHRDKLTKRDFQIAWECPYCERSEQHHDETDGIEQFKTHLFDHVEPLMASGTHVAEDINGTGSVLVRAPVESTGANNARVHFLAPADIALFVTMNPERRIRLLDEKLQEWPAWTIILTTKDKPLSGIDDVDLDDVPLEIVKLDRRLGLSDLGETVSRVLDEQENANGKISLEFDILPEIIEKFQLQMVFKFLHVLTNRLQQADALSHYYVNPKAESGSTINVLEELFDISITATEDTFTSKTRGSGVNK